MDWEDTERRLKEEKNRQMIGEGMKLVFKYVESKMCVFCFVLGKNADLTTLLFFCPHTQLTRTNEDNCEHFDS